MLYRAKELTEWAVKCIEDEFKDDVCLLIGRKHPWRIKADGEAIAFSYFVPQTDRGYQLSETFIIEGIGYDLFPRSWERLEDLSKLNGDVGGLLDAEILYAKSEDDVRRFETLKRKAFEHLN